MPEELPRLYHKKYLNSRPVELEHERGTIEDLMCYYGENLFGSSISKTVFTLWELEKRFVIESTPNLKKNSDVLVYFEDSDEEKIPVRGMQVFDTFNELLFTAQESEGSLEEKGYFFAFPYEVEKWINENLTS